MAETLWTPEDVRLCGDMWLAGFTLNEIAAKLGRSRGSISGLIWRKGLANDDRAFAARRDRRLTKEVERLSDGRVRRPRPKSPQEPPQPLYERVGILAPPEPPRPPSAPPEVGRPWEECRRSECAWPVSGGPSDTYSCCRPATRGSYCEEHAERMFTKPTAQSQKNLRRMARIMR